MKHFLAFLKRQQDFRTKSCLQMFKELLNKSRFRRKPYFIFTLQM